MDREKFRVILPYINACMHACIHTCMHAYIHASLLLPCGGIRTHIITESDAGGGDGEDGGGIDDDMSSDYTPTCRCHFVRHPSMPCHDE